MASRGKQCVYLGRPVGDFKPTRPWSMPAAFADVRLHAKNLTSWDANGFVRAHNKGQIASGLGNETWAFVLHSVRPRHGGNHVNGQAGGTQSE